MLDFIFAFVMATLISFVVVVGILVYACIGARIYNVIKYEKKLKKQGKNNKE